MIAQLIYPEKCGRPDISLAVQFLCTRVQSPTVEDSKWLERLLGCLQLSKGWNKIIDRTAFERIESYMVASFGTHVYGKSQLACLMVILDNTLVHEACHKQKIVTKSLTEAELVALSDFILDDKMVEELIMDIGHWMDEDLVMSIRCTRTQHVNNCIIKEQRRLITFKIFASSSTIKGEA